MADYTGYSSSDIVQVGTAPVLVGNDEDADVANTAQGSLTVTSTKLYRPVMACNPNVGLKPVIIVQWTPGYTGFDITDDTDDLATLEIFPCFKSTSDVGADIGSNTVNFVYGCDKIDLTKGLMGEIGQESIFPADLDGSSGADIVPSLDHADDYTRAYMVTEVWPGNMPMGMRLTIKATNGKGSATTMKAGLWIVGS